MCSVYVYLCSREKSQRQISITPTHMRTRQGAPSPPPPPPHFANVKIRAKFGKNPDKYSVFFFLLACQNMLRNLGAFVYPYADTGIEGRIFLARD